MPKPFTKADADRAEVLEANLAVVSTSLVTAAVTPGCQVYWPAPFEVCGRIRDKYNQTGGPNGFLLFPKSNELTNPDRVGKRSEFLGGNIYWTAVTDAHPVAHDFLTKWGQYGYEGGFMKYPTTDEIVLGGLDGRRQEFQGTTLFYSIPTGTHNVQGAIRDKYRAIGAQTNALGFPITDETVTPDGKGRFNNFQNGAIYWSAATGAHPVSGAMLVPWGGQGFESGEYGYPIDDGSAIPTGIRQTFQRKVLTLALRIPTDGSQAGVHKFDFQRDTATTYIDEDSIGKFSGQVNYTGDSPLTYPMAWGHYLGDVPVSLARYGPTTAANCATYHYIDGKRSPYFYDQNGHKCRDCRVFFPFDNSRCLWREARRFTVAPRLLCICKQD